MELARTFVSFSSTDIKRYQMMRAWKAHEHINFNFADFQLDEAISSKNPYYIRSRCAAKIRRADTFVLLIGTDTYTKTRFVEPEVEVAIEKGCRLIGVNLNNCQRTGSEEPVSLHDPLPVAGLYSSVTARAVSASEDKTLKMWEVQSAALLATFTCDGATRCCALANNGRLIVAGDAGGGVHLLRLEEAKPKC